jgi:hypothetical protein
MLGRADRRAGRGERREDGRLALIDGTRNARLTTLCALDGSL